MMYNFKNIKEHYEYLTPIIMEAAKRTKRGWVSPYSNYVDWMKMFSPIEVQTWMALRCFGQCPLYPQYPVGKYFLDFGNPAVKVGVECDGEEWHTDKEKDLYRDKVLSKLGWTIYRISGSDCCRITEGYDDLDYKNEDETVEILNKVYSSTIEGLIKAIALFHFEYRCYNRYVNEFELSAQCLLDRVSVKPPRYQEKLNQFVIKGIKNVPKDLIYQTRWA